MYSLRTTLQLQTCDPVHSSENSGAKSLGSICCESVNVFPNTFTFNDVALASTSVVPNSSYSESDESAIFVFFCVFFFVTVLSLEADVYCHHNHHHQHKHTHTRTRIYMSALIFYYLFITHFEERFDFLMLQ